MKTNQVSPGLLPLETGEVPADYRLFFDAPILAAYRYTARPFTLKLSLSPLAQGDSLSQVVDRASLTTRISKEGQVLTEAHYFVKNRGHPYFRLTLPAGNELWSATVNGSPVVPVTEGNANLIPLPQRADPNAVLALDLQLASRSADAHQVRVAAPIVNAPVMLAEWKIQPDAGQRLQYRRGSLTPLGGVLDASGFAGLIRAFTGDDAGRAWVLLLAGLFLVSCTLALWRWGSRAGILRFSPRHVVGLMLGFAGLFMACITFYHLGELVSQQRIELPRETAFLAPVQQAGSALNIEVSNLPDKTSAASLLGYAWPALLALVMWLYAFVTEKASLKYLARISGWLLMAWAALRTPNGAVAFLFVLASYLLLQVIVPLLWRSFQLPRQTQPAPGAAPGGATAAAAVVLAFGLFSAAMPSSSILAAGSSPAASAASKHEQSIAESISQQIRVEERFAFATARIHWHATKGQVLPLLFEPAVMTRLVYPSNALALVTSPAGARRGEEIIARKDGAYDIFVQYELKATQRDNETGFALPVCYGLINRLILTVHNLDVDVLSPQAVSVQRELSGSNTVATLVLSPAVDTWIAWKPRSRDVKHEKAVFYSELSQLYVPAAGVIEGIHYVSFRPAQGELNELILDVPEGATITDVLDPRPANQTDTNNPSATALASVVSLWRFDPEAHKLRITLKPAQSRSFALLVRSQVPTEPLPFEKSLGLLRVEGAAGQIGLVAVATGNEVQLDDVRAQDFSPINLEDFPNELAAMLSGQIPGLTVRRAFRYGVVGQISRPAQSERLALGANPGETPAPQRLSVRASAVEPDIRVETQDTLSLGEDRTVLAVNAAVEITRAGIFRLSFALPAGMDVESIAGKALSHWTELKTDAGRVITLHLPGRRHS